MVRHRTQRHIGNRSLYARWRLPMVGEADRPVRRPHTICAVRLLEREDDLAALGAQWERAEAGRGGLAIITGEAGAGKSALLETFTSESVASVPVLWGTCDPRSLPRPLGPLLDVADRLDLPRSVLDDA